MSDRLDKIAEDVAYMRGKMDSLPCNNGGCSWNIKQKAVAGTGITGSICALIMALYSVVTGGK